MTPGSVRHYVNNYKLFSERLTSLLKLAMNEQVTQSTSDEILTLTDTLLVQIKE